MDKASPGKTDPFAVLKLPQYRLLLSGRFLLNFAIQMQSVIVGWQIYEITGDPLSLGLVGLAEAIPFLSIALFAGYFADKFRRKIIILRSTLVYILSAVSLFIISLNSAEIKSNTVVLLIYSVIFFTGLARGFYYPAQMGFIAQIVPRHLFPNSSTWSSVFWHIAAVTGPATGGLIYGFAGIIPAYAGVILMSVSGFILFLFNKNLPPPSGIKTESIIKSLKTGVKFVFNNQIIFGAMALDMFAVLFGGAVALLPVFAGEILMVGPKGLGLLRAAPAFGAVLMSLMLAYRPPMKHTGKYLLGGVTGFGLCIIVFALSESFLLSLTVLFFSGMFDNISVVIRSTIIQLFTPDEMRGRVASVNSIFVGSSNEIGSFESGLAARIMGVVPSVIFGGSMTLLTVFTTGRLAPRLYRLNLSESLKEEKSG